MTSVLTLAPSDDGNGSVPHTLALSPAQEEEIRERFFWKNLDARAANDRVIFIRLTREVIPDTPEQLYEQTRRSWFIGARARQHAALVASVAGGTVREIYDVHQWAADANRPPGNRWLFAGRRAPEDVRRRHVGWRLTNRFDSGPLLYSKGLRQMIEQRTS